MTTLKPERPQASASASNNNQPSQTSETLKIKMPTALNLSALSTTELVMLLEMVSVELKNRHGVVGSPASRTDMLAADVPNLTFKEVTGIHDDAFKVLPERLSESEVTRKNAWKFVLVSPDDAAEPIAIQAVGDVIIGRSEEGVTPDLDLTAHQENAPRSISRVHAVIRPGEKHLTLTDLGSTNGTFINGEKLVAGRPITLSNKMTLTFGKAHLQVQLMQKPGANAKD